MITVERPFIFWKTLTLKEYPIVLERAEYFLRSVGKEIHELNGNSVRRPVTMRAVKRGEEQFVVVICGSTGDGTVLTFDNG